VEVDVPQPGVVFRHRLENSRREGDTRVVEHRTDRLRRPVAYLGREILLRRGIADVEDPQQRRAAQQGLGLLQPRLVDIGQRHRTAVR
jgi:hypothetical protein